MKRQSLHLFEAVGLVDEHLVEEAADAKRTASPWGKWLASAACFVLVLSLGAVAAGTLLRGCGSKAPSNASGAPVADTAMPPATSEEAPAGEAAEESVEMVEGTDEPAEAEAPAEEPAAAAPEPADAGPAVVTENDLDGEQEKLGELGSPVNDALPAPLAAGGAGLTAARALTLTVDAGGGTVLDRYVLTNSSEQAVTVSLSFPEGWAGSGLRVAPDADDGFSVTVPAKAEETLELRYALPGDAQGNELRFTIPASTAGTLALTETCFQLQLAEGMTLAWSTLPDDPTGGLVVLDPALDWSFAVRP